jgi:hypothetical protein
MSLYPPDNPPYFAAPLALLAQYEYGKFLPLALSAAPVGFGNVDGNKPYAILTYQVNAQPLSAGSVTAEVSAVSIRDNGSGALAGVDAVKGLKVNPYHSIVRVSSNGLTTGLVVTNSAGNLGTIIGGIDPAQGSGFVQIFDSTTFPVSGSTPLLSFFVPASGTFSVDYGTNGVPCVSGIVIVSSSTFSTYTSAVSANILALATYWVN